MKWLRKRIFGLSPEEATFAKRGFSSGDDDARERLERVGKTFIQGFNASIESGGPDDSLGQAFNQVDAEFRGFAFEGAAMGFGIQDFVLRWRRDRWRRFLEGPGGPHIYMVHVGLGWAWARMGRPVEGYLARLDPLLGWLAVDGYGFHEGYFHPQRYVDDQNRPRKLSGYASRVFDQGLGRSMWFVRGGGVERIIDTVRGFPPARHHDLWAGVGLACTYAGGANETGIGELKNGSERHWPALAQGAAFAAKSRLRAGNPTDHTEKACRILCEASAEEAATATDAALAELPKDGAEPAYESWRKSIQSRISEVGANL